MIRILLVDDHDLFRTGLISVLDQAPDLEVMGQVDSGEVAIEFVRQTPPDVILMDINMPGIGGIEATRKVLRVAPDVKVIAVTALTEDPFPTQLLDAGAVGYLTKGCQAEQLFQAIRSVALGRHYLSPDIAQKLALGRMASGDAGSRLQTLSAREMQVMQMIVDGQTIQAISDSLYLSPKTVSTYRHRLCEKLGVSNDVELTRFAIRHNLIDEV